jgi:Glycosyl transferase family 2
MASDTIVIVTARDEAARIGATLAGIASAFPGAPVWVVDDGSTDATPTIARGAGARVVRSARAIGKGGAATIAAREALPPARAPRAPPRGRVHGGHEHVLDRGGPRDDDEPVIVFCDGDLGESAARLGPLAEAVRSGEADVAVAAFAARAGGGFGLARAFARWAIRRRCGLRTQAPLSGQRALRAHALRDTLPFAPGFGMEVGITIDAVRAGHRVLDLELDLSHRTTGRTPAGFAHRARQLIDCIRVYLARGYAAPR